MFVCERYFRGLALLVTVTVLTGNVRAGQDVLPSAEKICAAIRQVEGRLQNLRIRYTYSTSGYVKGQLVKIVGQGLYAHRLRNDYPNMQLFIDRTSYWIDSNGMEQPYHSFVFARDGKVTKVLVRNDLPQYRESDSRRGLVQGYVYKGSKGSPIPTWEDPFRVVFWGGLHKLLSQAVEEGLFKVVEMGQWEGLSTVILENRFDRDPNDPNSHEGYTRIWICPDRGFMPVRRLFVVDGKAVADLGFSDFIELPNGVWYPRRIQGPPAEVSLDGRQYPLVLKIEEISVDPLSDGLFAFEFPAGVRVYDEVERLNYTTY